MPRMYRPILFFAVLTIFLVLSIQVQAQAGVASPSGRPQPSIHNNGTFSSNNTKPSSTRHRNATLTPSITDSGGFATGSSILGAGEQVEPRVVVGGLWAAVLGAIFVF